MKRGPYKNSFIYNLHERFSADKESFLQIVESSQSIREVCKKLNVSLHGSAYPAFKKFFKEQGISTKHFTGQAWNGGKKYFYPRVDPEKILTVKTKKQQTSGVRASLLKLGRALECEICKLGPIWNGKKLVLQIDHRNGDRLDDREENVRFLCPNCHSQTDTFASKNTMKRRSRLGIPMEEKIGSDPIQ